MASSEAAKRYRGGNAVNYNAERLVQSKWHVEQDIVSQILDAVAQDVTIVDVPVGTGRFFEFYKRVGAKPTGVDVSADMIAEASKRAAEVGVDVEFHEGVIQRLPLSDKSFAVALCIRLMNLVEFSIVAAAIRELGRVSQRNVILGVRHYVPTSVLIRSPRDLLGQAWFRFRRMTGQKVFIVHNEQAILAEFKLNGLKVVRAVSVDRIPRGTELMIYLLEH